MLVIQLVFLLMVANDDDRSSQEGYITIVLILMMIQFIILALFALFQLILIIVDYFTKAKDHA